MVVRRDAFSSPFWFRDLLLDDGVLCSRSRGTACTARAIIIAPTLRHEIEVPKATVTHGLGIDQTTLSRALVANLTEQASERGRTVLGEPEHWRRRGATWTGQPDRSVRGYRAKPRGQPEMGDAGHKRWAGKLIRVAVADVGSASARAAPWRPFPSGPPQAEAVMT